MDVPSLSSQTTSTSQSGSSAATSPVTTAQSSPQSTTASASPTDTVTLSSAALQVLANDSTSQSADATAPGNGANMQDPQVAAFYSNAAILTDTSGKYSQDQQLQAYVSLWNTMEAGYPAGLGSDASQVWTAAMNDSPMAQLAQQLSTGYCNAGSSTFDMNSTNNAQMSAQASLNYVNGLPDFDKQVLFETNVNATMANGKGSWLTSVDEWISSLQDTANNAPPPTSDQSTLPVGLSAEQKKEVAEITGANANTTANGASPANGTASGTPFWSDPAVSQALIALNDTSGKTSVADQISAFDLMTRMVSNGANFDPSNAANSNAVDIATAFQTSAFAQHAQTLADQMFAYNNQSGISASEAGQRKLDYFNSLSSDDQKIVVATMGAATVAKDQKPLYSSVESYTANLQAGINVNRALEVAYANPTYQAGMSANMPSENVDANTAQQMDLQKQASAAGDTATAALVALKQANLTGDAFTAAANSYFAEYRPPPAQTDAQKAEDAAPAPTASTTKIDASAVRSSYQDLTVLNDSSGTVSAADMVAAWQKANTDIAKVGGASNLAHISLMVNSTKSNASVTIQNAGNAYDNASWAGRGGTEVSAVHNQIAAFHALSGDDQVIVAATRSMPGYAQTTEGYLAYLSDGLKNAAQGDAINAAAQSGNQALYHQLIANLVDYTNKTGVAMNGAAAAPDVETSDNLQSGVSIKSPVIQSLSPVAQDQATALQTLTALNAQLRSKAGNNVGILALFQRGAGNEIGTQPQTSIVA